MNRKHALLLAVALGGGFAIACGGGMAEESGEGGEAAAVDPNATMAPMFEVDPIWPKT